MEIKNSLHGERVLAGGICGTAECIASGREMIDGFLSYKRQQAKKIAVGPGLIMIADVFGCFPDYEQKMLLLYWGVVAAGIAVLIWTFFQPRLYREIYTKNLIFDEAVIKNFRADRFINAAAVMLLILAGMSIYAEHVIRRNAEYRTRKKSGGRFAWIWAAARFGDKELEKLSELTIYEDSDILKEQIDPEVVKNMSVSEEYLTFYMTVSEEDREFLLSLAGDGN